MSLTNTEGKINNKINNIKQRKYDTPESIP